MTQTGQAEGGDPEVTRDTTWFYVIVLRCNVLSKLL